MDQNTRKSIVAYYLSKFDLDAVCALGYSNRSEAFTDLSRLIGIENNYMKRRRDEFDVITGSHRNGQRNRQPTKTVMAFHDELKGLTFEEFTRMVKGIIDTCESENK